MKLRNPIAKELRTPKFKSKVIENKKKTNNDITVFHDGTRTDKNIRLGRKTKHRN